MLYVGFMNSGSTGSYGSKIARISIYDAKRCNLLVLRWLGTRAIKQACKQGNNAARSPQAMWNELPNGSHNQGGRAAWRRRRAAEDCRA